MNFLLKQRLLEKIATQIFFIPLYLYSSLIFSQSNYQQVDSLLSISKKESKNFQFEKSISISRKALYTAKKTSYKKGICESYYNIAYDLCDMGKYDESFRYINIIEKNYSHIIKENLDLNINLTDLKGRNYLALGFTDKAKKEFRKELILADLHKNKEQVYKDRLYAYVQLHASSKEADSSYYYLCKTLKYRNKIRDKKDFYFIYASFADYHIGETKSFDSAFYYNNESLKIGLKFNSPYLYVTYIQKAQILFLQKKYNESLKYAQIGLKKSVEKNRTEQVLAALKLIADNHHFLKNSMEELKYRNKYIHINDSMTVARNIGKQMYTNSVINEKELDVSASKTLFYKTLLLFIFIIILGILLFYYSIKKMEKKKKNIIDTKEKEVNSLRSKLEEDFYDELVTLAQNNSPEFLYRTKELYPQFFEKLLQLEPNLKTSELTFCSYLKLNYPTKEIAKYTFVTPKAIQNRKNRLRKRLNIPTDEDIYTWINKL